MSLMYEDESWAIGCRWKSTNLEMFSVGQLLAEIMGRPGFPALWIFGSRYRFAVDGFRVMRSSQVLMLIRSRENILLISMLICLLT